MTLTPNRKRHAIQEVLQSMGKNHNLSPRGEISDYLLSVTGTRF
jgi:hypothetical protein